MSEQNSNAGTPAIVEEFSSLLDAIAGPPIVDGLQDADAQETGDELASIFAKAVEMFPQLGDAQTSLAEKIDKGYTSILRQRAANLARDVVDRSVFEVAAIRAHAGPGWTHENTGAFCEALREAGWTFGRAWAYRAVQTYRLKVAASAKAEAATLAGMDLAGIDEEGLEKAHRKARTAGEAAARKVTPKSIVKARTPDAGESPSPDVQPVDRAVNAAEALAIKVDKLDMSDARDLTKVCGLGAKVVHAVLNRAGLTGAQELLVVVMDDADTKAQATGLSDEDKALWAVVANGVREALTGLTYTRVEQAQAADKVLQAASA